LQVDQVRAAVLAERHEMLPLADLIHDAGGHVVATSQTRAGCIDLLGSSKLVDAGVNVVVVSDAIEDAIDSHDGAHLVIEGVRVAALRHPAEPLNPHGELGAVAVGLTSNSQSPIGLITRNPFCADTEDVSDWAELLGPFSATPELAPAGALSRLYHHDVDIEETLRALGVNGRVILRSGLVLETIDQATLPLPQDCSFQVDNPGLLDQALPLLPDPNDSARISVATLLTPIRSKEVVFDGTARLLQRRVGAIFETDTTIVLFQHALVTPHASGHTALKMQAQTTVIPKDKIDLVPQAFKNRHDDIDWDALSSLASHRIAA